MVYVRPKVCPDCGGGISDTFTWEANNMIRADMRCDACGWADSLMFTVNNLEGEM